MISAAIDKILQLQRPPTFKANGLEYFANGSPVLDPIQDVIKFNTLTGLVAFYNNELLPNEIDVFAHVESHEKVSLRGPVFGPFKQRVVYASSSFLPEKGFHFGAYLDVESFVIALQSFFVQNYTTESILALVGNLKDEKVKNVSDDGKTQTVNAKTGIALVTSVEVPNPVALSPYRTFLEVEQPEIKCVIRLRSGRDGGLPECALFEADGGLWKLTAIQSIKEWLQMALPDGMAVLA